LLLLLRPPALAQVHAAIDPSVPIELIPVDIEIRELIHVGDDSCRAAAPDEWTRKVQEALQLADSRGLVGDRAVLESYLASALIAQGKTNEASLVFQQALQDSVDAKREVLQADILTSVSSDAQMKGNTQGAIDLVTKALSLSEKTGNLYGKARALGELGRFQLILGKNEQAATSIGEALNIDRLNGYKFEALHLVYKAYYLGMSGNLDEALETLSQARVKAAATNNTNSFLLAVNAYAFGLARKGQGDEATRLMALLKAGKLDEFVPDIKARDCLAVGLELPIFRVIALEGFANVLKTVNRKEEEIEVLRELFSVSEGLGLLAGQAEAQKEIADIENELKKTDEALKDYGLAATLYKALGNGDLLDQIEIAEAQLLVQVGRGKEAVPLVQEIISFAKSHGNRPLEFNAYLQLAQIRQPVGELSEARDALESAKSLVQPGPFDAEIDNHSVHQVYVRLADIYRALGLSTKELISIDQAFFVSAHLKDEDAQKREVSYLDQRLDQLHVDKIVEDRQKEGQLAESLIYSYVLYLRDTPTNLAESPNWQRLLDLPFQIAQKPGGAAELEFILSNLGPILGFTKLTLLDALAHYYIAAGANPILAEKYATECEDLLKTQNGDQSALRARSTCVLALSYSHQGKRTIAAETSAECLSVANRSNDAQAISYADAVNAMVQAESGNIAGAKTSIEKLITKSPDNTELLVELAMSLAGAKLYDEANFQLNKALGQLLSVGDKRTAAGAYARVSTILNSDSTEAARKLQLEYLKAAQRLYHDLGADGDEAGTLITLGDYFLKITQNKAAIDTYRMAQELAEKARQGNTFGQALLGLGNAYQNEGDFAKAEEFHEKAAKVFHQFDNNLGETISLTNLGRDLYGLGDPDKAFAVLVEARKTATSAGTLNEYFADYFLADLYRSQGQYEKAFASYRDAIEVTTKGGDIEHAAYSHLGVASIDDLVGNWDDALSETQTALGLFEKLANKEGQALCWAELTDIYADRTSFLKDFDKAQECYRKAKDLGYGTTLDLDLLEIYLQTGKYSDATKIANDRIQDCLKQKDNDCKAHALISLSEAERLGGNVKASREALTEARPLALKSPEFYLRGRLVYQESRLLASEGRLDDALASYEKLISLIEVIKGRLQVQEQKSLAENYGFIYDELVSLLYSMSKKSPRDQVKFASESLEYAEKNKARQFADTWGRVFRNQMRLALPPPIQERERTLISQRDRLMAKIESASDSGDSSQRTIKENLETDLSSVNNQIQAFLVELRKASPQYSAIAYPESIQLSNLPLRKDETLVEFKMTEQSTFAWIIRSRSGKSNELAAFYEVPQKRTWFLERLSSIRTKFNSGHPEAADWKICEELFAALFPPDVMQIIADSQEIVFIPDDVLFVLPFELFSPGASKGEFFFLQKPTTYYPSAVSLRLARTATHPSAWQSAFLGIADPITSPEDERFGAANALTTPEKGADRGGNSEGTQLKPKSDSERLKSRGFSFERLPATATEVQTIASLLKERKEPVDVRFGVKATKTELLDTDLSRFRFVHFATHGVLPVDTSIQEPSLVLSYDGVKPEHMFLSMSEILDLKLQSESVVLSACNTGSGKISRAEGVMSLGRAFLAAGAASVTVSLWQVADESTAMLMARYYKGLLENEKKSVALAEARNAVFVSGSKNPYFWAPFIVIGD
jgi:CHAT domain-containing protein/tetratricopeptide (TPR) repeat protein